nr:MAG TPA: hypothetical protein [Caudoviricetes sp.]
MQIINFLTIAICFCSVAICIATLKILKRK